MCDVSCAEKVTEGAFMFNTDKFIENCIQAVAEGVTVDLNWRPV